MGVTVTLLFAGACADEVNTFATQGGDEQVVLTASTMGTGIATGLDEGLMGKPEAIKDRKLLFTYPAVPDGEITSAVCLFTIPDSGMSIPMRKRKNRCCGRIFT